MQDIVATKPKTQKAIGLFALSKFKDGHYPNGPKWIIPKYKLISSIKDITKFTKPVFARPCPIKPRHGFIDSRVVSNKTQLIDLFSLVKKEDEQAEIILMSKIEAELSAVLTPSQITIGPSNDGATKGEKTFSFPIAGVKRNKALEKQAKVLDTPYYELLKHKNKIYVVQLRDGPASGCGNIIPQSLTVKKVITINNQDLMQWEKLIAGAENGTVVYHPGGSALSHYSVHAIINKIPVLFDQKPSIDDKLSTNFKSEPKVNAFLKGIKNGLKHKDNKNLSKMLGIALFAVHNSNALINTKDGAELAGFGIGWLYKLSLATLKSEIRFNDYSVSLATRGKVINESLESSFKARKNLYGYFKEFSIGSWKCGYGGAAWAECAAKTIRLDNSITDFLSVSNEKNLMALIVSANIVVNLQHNNGFMLDKIMGNDSYYDNDDDQNLFAGYAKGNLYWIARAAFDFVELYDRKSYSINMPKLQNDILPADFKRIKKRYGI